MKIESHTLIVGYERLLATSNAAVQGQVDVIAIQILMIMIFIQKPCKYMLLFIE